MSFGAFTGFLYERMQENNKVLEKCNSVSFTLNNYEKLRVGVSFCQVNNS